MITQEIINKYIACYYSMTFTDILCLVTGMPYFELVIDPHYNKYCINPYGSHSFCMINDNLVFDIKGVQNFNNFIDYYTNIKQELVGTIQNGILLDKQVEYYISKNNYNTDITDITNLTFYSYDSDNDDIDYNEIIAIIRSLYENNKNNKNESLPFQIDIEKLNEIELIVAKFKEYQKYKYHTIIYDV
jgi:hypothetical protein